MKNLKQNLKQNLKESFQYVLAIFIVLAMVWLFQKVLTIEIPESNLDTFKSLAKTFELSFTLIIGYFFGSSMGSKSKTELLGKNKEL